MNPFTMIDRIEDLASLRAGPVEPLQAEVFRLTDPSRHLALQDATGGLLARCSLWRARDAHGMPTTDGLIGHYAALDSDAGRELLEYASNWHWSEGRERVIGPMDGSTWHRYRLLTERGTEPTFFLEPDNPDDWPRHFTDAGFVPLATYTSALNSDLSQFDPRSDRRRAEFERNGITIRTIALERFDFDLAAIHELSLEAFARNFLYSPHRARGLHCLLHSDPSPSRARARPSRGARRATRRLHLRHPGSYGVGAWRAPTHGSCQVDGRTSGVRWKRPRRFAGG